jgi:molecular chaperone GrpE
MMDEQERETPEAESQQPVGDVGGDEVEDTALSHMAAELEEARRRVAELEQELAHERDKANEYMHNWQRAQADFANFRRRSKEEQERLTKYADMDLFYELLAVLDNFARAFQTLPATLRQFTWINGIALTELQLRGTLQRYGVTLIEAAGKEFDPLEHQAVAHEETSEVPENTVLEVLQHGYKLHDRVLRPALVKVARARGATPSAEGGVGDKETTETKEALSG